MKMRWAGLVILLFLVGSRGCRGARNHAPRGKNVASSTVLSPEAYWQKTVPNVAIPESLLPLISPLTSSAAAHLKRLIQKGKLISSQRLSSAFCEAAGLGCNPDIPDPFLLQPGEAEDAREGGEEISAPQEPAMGADLEGQWRMLRTEEEQHVILSELGLARLESDTDIFKEDDPLLPAGDFDDFYDDYFKPEYSATPAPGLGMEFSADSYNDSGAPADTAAVSMDRTWMRRFFTLRELEQGDVDFHLGHLLDSPSSTRKLLTPDMAALLPISNTQELLQQFHIPAASQMGRAMAETAAGCDPAAIPSGESRTCVSTLEALADFLKSQNPQGTPVEVVTVPAPSDEFLTELSAGPFEVAASEVKADAATWKSVACVDRMFPFRVFECSSAPSTLVMTVSLESSSASDSDMAASALVLCYMDTVEWNPDHEAFLHLGSIPGETEVCQFLPRQAFLFLWKIGQI